MQIRVNHNQSLFDLSIQAYGSVAEVFTLAVANNISVTAVLLPNTIIDAPEIEVSEPETQAYYKKNNLRPATALSNETLTILQNNDACDICALFL